MVSVYGDANDTDDLKLTAELDQSWQTHPLMGCIARLRAKFTSKKALKVSVK